MQVDLATAADAVALREVHAATWADTYSTLLPPHFYEQRLRRHRHRDWVSVLSAQANAAGGVLVAREDEAILGLCQYGPSEDPDDLDCGVGHIYRLYVHPTAQRRRMGRALLEAAGRRLTAAGAVSLTLWALEEDRRARAFYERLGWAADGGRRFDGVWDVRYRTSNR